MHRLNDSSPGRDLECLVLRREFWVLGRPNGVDSISWSLRYPLARGAALFKNLKITTFAYSQSQPTHSRRGNVHLKRFFCCPQWEFATHSHFLAHCGIWSHSFMNDTQS